MTNALLERLKRIELAIFAARDRYPGPPSQELTVLLQARFEILGVIEGANAEL